MNVTNFGIIRSYLYFNVNGTVRISHINKLTAHISRSNVLNYSVFYKLLFLFLICVHPVFFLVLMLCIWQNSDNAPFFRTLFITFAFASFCCSASL